MVHIFISYSRQDEEFARKLALSLSELGADVWIDIEDIPAGMKWSTAIEQGLKVAEVMLVIISPDSMASKNVEDEWQYFLDKQKPVFPIHWRPADVHFQLNRIQYVDFHQKAYQVAFERLTDALTANGVAFPRDVQNLSNRTRPLQDTSIILPPPFEWCKIPAGKVTIAYSDTDHETFDVAAFAMAKYPITNAQYNIFINADDGYSDEKWWTYSDHAQLWRKKNALPNKQGSKGELMPRTNISWYDAMAYCQWLSAQTGEHIILPTEQQWQRAAQGDDNRAYPWGNEPLESSRDSAGSKAVADNASPFGVMGMCESVGEWTTSKVKERNADLNGDEFRTRRGGRESDAIARGTSNPTSQVGYIGFRIVRSTNKDT